MAFANSLNISPCDRAPRPQLPNDFNCLAISKSELAINTYAQSNLRSTPTIGIAMDSGAGTPDGP